MSQRRQQQVEIVDGMYSMKVASDLKMYVKRNDKNNYIAFGKCPYGLSQTEKEIFLREVMSEFKKKMDGGE